MPKRGNDNSQISKENYDDSRIRSTVEHGMTKASNEELKRRRTVSVSGNKKWSTLSSPGSSTKSSISTNPFASAQIGAATSSTPSASANNNPFAAIQFSKAPAASASTKATSPAKIRAAKPSPSSTHASFNNNVVASNDDGKVRKMALLERNTAIIESNNMFKENPEGLMDVINSEVESMKKIGWAKTTIVKNSAKKEKIRSVSPIAPKAETTLAATAKEQTNNIAPINDNPVMENETTSNKNMDEEEMYHAKARAYKDTIPSSGWKDFGTGTIKLLHNKSTDKYQLLLREEQLGKPIINVSIVKGMKVTNNKNFIMLMAVMDKTIGPESFIFKVGKSNVDAFMKHLNDIVK